jgi:hypothetical protein
MVKSCSFERKNNIRQIIEVFLQKFIVYRRAGLKNSNNYRQSALTFVFTAKKLNFVLADI